MATRVHHRNLRVGFWCLDKKLMRSPPSIQLVYLSAQGQGMATCPRCTEQATVSASAYRDLHAPVMITGTCGHCFPVLFNTRHFDRKAVCLSGRYTLPGENTSRQMTVTNLSLIGVHFRTGLPHTLQADDRVNLDFALDDPQHTEMHHPAMVRWVDDKQLGAEFCNLQAYERELSFYLRPT